MSYKIFPYSETKNVEGLDFPCCAFRYYLCDNFFTLRRCFSNNFWAVSTPWVYQQYAVTAGVGEEYFFQPNFEVLCT